MASTRAKDLGRMIDVPPNPFTGRNCARAWERGFDWRCWTERPGPRAPQPYVRKASAEAFALGWKTADDLIRAELQK